MLMDMAGLLERRRGMEGAGPLSAGACRSQEYDETARRNVRSRARAPLGRMAPTGGCLGH
ncbi:hypothetical protein GCM10010245_18010 [Streptomyces spectabilis]|uniref:Uncharacterized protein n=1 Tax=Streptomyces spectabilis TaxID=68270 RepID=A0A5P2X2I5_STRST|nr:hypothetical protein CP982_03695 [Streptomyces spectabilis]GGV09526.1 hypothetical protein GCM10010245_18010 [Streptomyces spectabilis]